MTRTWLGLCRFPDVRSMRSLAENLRVARHRSWTRPSCLLGLESPRLQVVQDFLVE